jgi:Protein of unknown function (DUF5672)
MKLFERVLLSQHRWLKAGDFRIQYRADNERTAVIVEPRRHPMLRAVIENVLFFLGKEWNLHIITAEANRDWLRETLEPHTYTVSYLSMDNLTRDQYSELLLNPVFWEVLPTDHILIFQTDVIVFRPWNKWFERFDYIGPNYYHPDHIFPNGVGGIQGGLSYRKRSAMLACLRTITEDDVRNYRISKGLSALPVPMVEDIYFTHACAMLQKTLPSIEARPFFGIEAVYYPTPFGFHGWNHPYYTEEENRELLWGSPELRKWALK